MFSSSARRRRRRRRRPRRHAADRPNVGAYGRRPSGRRNRAERRCAASAASASRLSPPRRGLPPERPRRRTPHILAVRRTAGDLPPPRGHRRRAPRATAMNVANRSNAERRSDAPRPQPADEPFETYEAPPRRRPGTNGAADGQRHASPDLAGALPRQPHRDRDPRGAGRARPAVGSWEAESWEYDI